MLTRETPRNRWARTDRFTLSIEGEEAEAAYRAAIVASREQPGRSAFDAARAEWARTFSLEPDDGVYLGELRGGPTKLTDLIEALDVCGKTRKDALEALGRLVDGGLVEVQQREPDPDSFSPSSGGWNPMR